MADKLPLTVTIVTFNEEKNLPPTLDSVADMAREIIVLDSFSTDRTVEIARQHGARVEQRPWPGFLAQKQFAHSLATCDWVLNLDADERPSPQLCAEIRRALTAAAPSVAAIECNRKTFYMGRWIEHSWNPDWIIRLVRRDRAEWGGSALHPKLIPRGDVIRVGGDLLHHPYANFRQHLERIMKLERVNADVLDRKGVRARWHHILFRPLGAFLKKLLLKGSWRDGVPGLVIAMASLVAVFAKYTYLWEKQNLSGPSLADDKLKARE